MTRNTALVFIAGKQSVLLFDLPTIKKGESMKRWTWKATFRHVDTNESYVERSSETFDTQDLAQKDLQIRVDGRVPFNFARRLIYLPSELEFTEAEFQQKEM